MRMRVLQLDGLRGIASFMVVMLHYDKSVLPLSVYSHFAIRHAFIFVDFFFVLSGFVMAMNYADHLNNGQQFRSYLRKRFIRLYPLLAYTTLIYLSVEILTSLVFPSSVQTPADPKQLLEMTMDTLLMTNATPLLGTSDGMNFPAWSISAEMISYLVFGWIMTSCRGKARLMAIGGVMALSAAILMIHGRYFSGGEFGFARALLCFHAGVLTWLLPVNRKMIGNKYAYLVPAFIITALYLLKDATGMQRNIIGVALLPILFSVSILILTRTRGPLVEFLENRMMRFAGRISYSVYLNHAILLLVIPRLIFNIAGIPKTAQTELITFGLTMVILLIYSTLTFEFIEKKGGRWLNRIMGKRSTDTPGSGEHQPLMPIDKPMTEHEIA